MYGLIFKILNMSITATLTALAVILLRLILKRAPKWIPYALWSVVLFRLICPVSLSSAFSLLGGIGAPAAENGAVPYIPENIAHSAAPQGNLLLPSLSEAMNGSMAQGEEQPAADPLEAPEAIAAFPWLLGVAAMLVYSVVSYVLLKRRLSDATWLEDNVFETEAILSPFVCGLIKPRIYLPVGLTGPARGYVLLHERTHIRRRDYLIKPLAFLALSVHWFNPVIWLSFRLMCRDMEMSCDERVARELDPAGRAGYSAALLRLATGRPIPAGSPLTFGENGAKERIKNILGYKKPAFWAVAAAAVACAAAAVCLLTNPAGISLHLDRQDISSATALDFRRGDPYTRELQEADMDELASRLAAVSGMRRSEKYAGLTPLYSITVALDDGTTIRICGYSAAGDMLDITYKGETYCVRDSGFASYVDRICAGENVTSATNAPRLASVYVYDQCLYMNPASSYYPFEGTGQLYLCRPDGFTIVSGETGEIQESDSPVDWRAKEVDTDEWSGMFRGGETVDISGYQSRLEYDISGRCRLYQMDGEVWLGQFSGEMLWNLYRLRETDIPLADIAGRASIPENKTLRADSPDGAYAAEAYGTNTRITAAGMYPYEGLRVIRNSDGAAVWSGMGYYRPAFLWSGDSKYVAVYGEARTWGECFLVEAGTGEVIGLPDMDAVAARLGAASQPAADRPDPSFKAVEWTGDTTIRVEYRWIAQEGEKEVSGAYEYDIAGGDIVSNTFEINHSPG